MVAIDYVAIADKVKTLITLNGRSITLNRFDQSPADANTPWEGPSDPVGTPDATASIAAIFVPPSGANQLGLRTVDLDLMKRTKEIAIIAPGAASPPFDLATANQVVDGGSTKKVSFVETLKPANTTLLYFIGILK